MIGYWATLEHAATWPGEQQTLMKVRENNGQLTPEVTGQIARAYKVARSFRGAGRQGYGTICDVINSVDVSKGLSIVDRVDGALSAVKSIVERGYSNNPSGVSKLLWFRQPDDWYMYDRQAALAVGAGLSSASGLRGFFGILHACDVAGLNREIGGLAAVAGIAVRPERIIDKFLWLRGAGDDEKAIARLRAKEPALLREQPGLHAFAGAVQKILPDDRFDLIKRAI